MTINLFKERGVSVETDGLEDRLVLHYAHIISATNTNQTVSLSRVYFKILLKRGKTGQMHNGKFQERANTNQREQLHIKFRESQLPRGNKPSMVLQH